MVCPDHLSPALAAFALRSESLPSLCGHAIAVYRAAHGMSDDDLVDWLGLADPHDLGRLKMCGRPRPDHLADDLAALAGRFGCDAGRLGEILVGAP